MEKYKILVFFGIILMLLFSGCVEKEQVKEIQKYNNYNVTCKENIIKEYDWKIIELKTETLRAATADEIIENETKKELENFTKEYLIKNAKEYELTDEDIAYIKNLSEEEFEQFKEEHIAGPIKEKIKKDIIDAVNEIIAEYNYTILDIKEKDKIKDIAKYLESFGVESETIENLKNKSEKAKYIVVVGLNVSERLIVPEFCDEKGKIIKDEKD